MNRDNNSFHGFTLLELVVVLAILAVVTAIATRSLGKMEDQRRFETSQRGLDELEAAVLGSDNDRAPDGSRMINGFVADMGRLPRTVLDPAVTPPALTLRELWSNPGALYDARQAIAVNGVAAADEDLQVLVLGGWRGPYLRLPLGAVNLLDGWGNDYSSPTDAPPPELAFTTGYARLRDVNDLPLTATGQSIVVVRHLGANGTFEIADANYDRDQAIAFTEDRIRAVLKGSVEVLDGENPAVVDGSDTITVKVFAPSPANPAQIVVYRHVVPFATNPINYEISVANDVTAAALTFGPRVVRAYFSEPGTPGTTSFTKSAVKSVVLRPGVNTQDLKIDR